MRNMNSEVLDEQTFAASNFDIESNCITCWTYVVQMEMQTQIGAVDSPYVSNNVSNPVNMDIAI
jgi:hypothetical protein